MSRARGVVRVEVALRDSWRRRVEIRTCDELARRQERAAASYLGALGDAMRGKKW